MAESKQQKSTEKPVSEQKLQEAGDKPEARAVRGQAGPEASPVTAVGRAQTADPQGSQEGTQGAGFRTPSKDSVSDLSDVVEETGTTLVTVKENVYERFLPPGATTTYAERLLFRKGQQVPRHVVDQATQAYQEQKDPVVTETK